MVETPVASTICMTQKGMQNIPTLQALLWPAWQKSLFDPPQPKLAVFQAVFELLISLHIQIAPALPFHVDGEKVSSQSSLTTNIPLLAYSIVLKPSLTMNCRCLSLTV